MNSAMLILLKYPSLLPKNSQLTEFYGFLNIHGIDYEINLQHVNNKPSLHITQNLEKFKQQIAVLCERTTDTLEFLDLLHETIHSHTTRPIPKNLSDLFRRVINEYIEFREFYINLKHCTISVDLSEIVIEVVDECNRTHKLTITVDYNNGGIFKILRHELPEKEDFMLPNTSLNLLYEKFLKAIGELQEYFNLMDSFDSSCWILDPENPLPKDCYRRIGFDENISMVITINPWKCSAIPSLQFLGSEKLVNNFRLKVSNNLENWDIKSNTFDEMLRLLEISSFPSKPELDEDDVVLYNVGDCCICFSLRLNEKLPEIICENSSCEQFFHAECLYQWLISIGTKSKQTFNELHGDCPNCEKHISCPLP